MRTTDRPRPPLPPTTSAAPLRSPKSVTAQITSRDGEVRGVPAGRPVGQDVLLVAGLHAPLLVDRAPPDGVVAFLDVRGAAPLHPRVVGGQRGDLTGGPLTVIDGELHR